ncbi:MAG: DinB family protein [Flavobacteriaceae bacterium]
MDNLEKFKDEYVANACYRMDESLRMVRMALEKIDGKQLWQRPNTSLNSIGNLILHLCGNITQYGIVSLYEQPDERDRDSEFSVEGGYSKAELLQELTNTVRRAKEAFQTISIDRHLAHKKVQGFDFSGIGNIIHVVEHFSYHTGQIAFWVKMLNDAPLGFYEGVDLNILNDE